jgi:putative membrane protein
MMPFPMPDPPPPPSRLEVARRVTLRWLITSLSIFAAVYVVPGISFVGPGWELGLVALLFGLVNVILRPILTLLTCPLVVLTLGLFTLVINALLLLLTADIARSLGVQFTVDGFWSGVLGGLVISVVSTLLNVLAGETPLRVEMRRPQQ